MKMSKVNLMFIGIHAKNFFDCLPIFIDLLIQHLKMKAADESHQEAG